MSSAPKQRERSPRDLYITPEGVTEPLLAEIAEACGWGPDAHLRILDVGAGTGRLTAACRRQWPEALIVACEIEPLHRPALREAGADLTWTGDYLSDGFAEYGPIGYDLIIGNPPYSLAQPFLEQSLRVPERAEVWGRGVPIMAFLVNTNFLGSDERADFFAEHLPVGMRMLAPRPSFTQAETGKQETDSVEYAWMLWTKSGEAIPGLPPFGWYVWRATRKRLALITGGGAAEQ